MHSAIVVSAAALCALFSAVDARAQSYPVRPVRMIVAFEAGGAPDAFARIVAQKLREQMGQPVIVDNRPRATPRPVIEQLNAQIARVLREPEVAEQFARQGAAVNASTPAALGAMMKNEVEKWSRVARGAALEKQ